MSDDDPLDLLEEALGALGEMEGVVLGGDEYQDWADRARALLAKRAAAQPKPMTIIETFSGIGFDLLTPRPEDVCLSDIAHALARINRFVGHTGKGYSVAEHSLWVWLVASVTYPDDYELQLHAQIHDAGEAYAGDVSGPLKAALRRCRGVANGHSALDHIENRIDSAIRFHLGIPVPSKTHREIIKVIDTRMRETERRCPVLMPNTRDENWPPGVKPIDHILDGTFGLVPMAMLPEDENDGRFPTFIRLPSFAALQEPPERAGRPTQTLPLSETDIAFLFEHNVKRLLAMVKRAP